MEDAERSPSHMPQLDGLRAIAVAMVALHHWHQPRLLGGQFPFDFGVNIFFVLSGFLITRILVDVRHRIDGDGRGARLHALKAFWMRRILRLGPALFGYLAVAIALGYVSDVVGLGWYLGYLGNLRIDQLGHWPQGTAHLWSLAVEEQFYLLMPLVVLWLPKRWLAPFFGVGLIVSVVASTTADATSRLLPPAAFGGLFVGCLAALLFDAHRHDRRAAWLARLGTPGVLLAIAIGTWGPKGNAIVFTGNELLLHVAAAAVTWRAALNLGHRVLEAPLMEWLGRISYGIYLWHFVALYLTVDLVGDAAAWPIRLVLATVLTLVFTHASDVLLERRFTARKRNNPYVRPSDPDRTAALTRA